jgi:hypothetical protein
MTRTTRRPGQNIRELAQKRRRRAIVSFGSSVGIIVCLPIAAISESIVAKIYANLKPPADSPITFPLAFYVIFATLALLLALNGISLWKKANRATQGAKGEEATGKQLIELKREGWDIEYGMRLGSGLGDAFNRLTGYCNGECFHDLFGGNLWRSQAQFF